MLEELKRHADVLENVSLNKYNTYHIGGLTKYLVSPLSINDLIETIKILDKNKIPYFIYLYRIPCVSFTLFEFVS